ncbi:MAG: hypothetical protein WCW02_04985 [Candidatus Buchananbacteria bacterium]
MGLENNESGLVGSEELTAKVVKLEQVLAENLVLTKQIDKRVHKINRWIFWQKSYTVAKLFFWILLLVAMYWYLPPLVQKMLSPYQQALQQASQFNSGFKSLNLNQIDLKGLNLNQILNQK